MVEVLLVVLLLAGLLIFPLLGQMDPEVLLILIAGLLNLINFAMTVINSIQARRKNPRFLHAGLLGSVQILVGISLLITFGLTLGLRVETWISGIPYMVGGIIVLLVCVLTSASRNTNASGEIIDQKSTR